MWVAVARCPGHRLSLRRGWDHPNGKTHLNLRRVIRSVVSATLAEEKNARSSSDLHVIDLRVNI